MQEVPIECARCRDEVEAHRLGPTGVVIVDKEPDALGRLCQLAGVMLRMIPDGEPSQKAHEIHEGKAVELLLRRYSEHKDTCKALPRSKAPEATPTVPTRPHRRPLP